MKNIPYQIVLMKAQDIPSMLKLWKKVKLSVSTAKRETIEIKSMLEKNPTSCFIAVKDHQIIGSIFGAYNGRRGWIYHLAVHQKWQKKGLGAMLLKNAEKALLSLGVTKILLGVRYANLKVAPFYEKYGFSVINDTVIMEKDLYMKITTGNYKKALQ